MLFQRSVEANRESVYAQRFANLLAQKSGIRLFGSLSDNLLKNDGPQVRIVEMVARRPKQNSIATNLFVDRQGLGRVKCRQACGVIGDTSNSRASGVPCGRAQLRRSYRRPPAFSHCVQRRHGDRSNARRFRRSLQRERTEGPPRKPAVPAADRDSQACSSPAALVSAATNAAHRPRCVPSVFRPSAVRRQ